MTDIISTTRQYEVSQKIKEEKLSLQEKNNSHKEIIEEIYYDENKFETIKPKFGLEKIHILIMVNQETLADKGLTLAILRDRIQQIIPLKNDRGDQLIIEEKLIDFTPPYIQMVENFFSETSMQRNIKLAIILIAIGLVSYGIFRLFLFVKAYQRQRELEAQAKSNALKATQIDATVIPLNKQVIKTIEGDTHQTQEIVEYWMEQHYAQK